MNINKNVKFKILYVINILKQKKIELVYFIIYVFFWIYFKTKTHFFIVLLMVLCYKFFNDSLNHDFWYLYESNAIKTLTLTITKNSLTFLYLFSKLPIGLSL